VDPFRHETNLCLFCGGDPTEPDHGAHCDGRQGGIEDTLYGSQGDVPYEVTSDTSADAAASVEQELTRLEARVYAALRDSPRTCDEVEIVTGLSHQTASARVRGLVLRDRVADSGRRGRTRSGRMAVIWEPKRRDVG
jgi:hypothetical protein